MLIKKSIIFFCLILLLSSCNFLLTRVIIGVKPPDFETENSIKKYEKRIGLNSTLNNYRIDSSFVDFIWSGAFPKAYIYDKNGRLMSFLDCFASKDDDIIRFFNLNPENRKEIPDTIIHIVPNDTIKLIAPKFSNIIAFTQPIFGSKPIIDPNSDYYIVYFWSKMFGRINKRSAVSIEKYVLKHPELKAKFVKINCDYSADWGYTKKEIREGW